jgi:hypothetical protein
MVEMYFKTLTTKLSLSSGLIVERFSISITLERQPQNKDDSCTVLLLFQIFQTSEFRNINLHSSTHVQNSNTAETMNDPAPEWPHIQGVG